MAYQYFNANVKDPVTGEQGMWYYTGMTDTQMAVAAMSSGGTYREVAGDVPNAYTAEGKAQIKEAYSSDYPSEPISPDTGVQLLAQTAERGQFGEVLGETKEIKTAKRAPTLPIAGIGLVLLAVLLFARKR